MAPKQTGRSRLSISLRPSNYKCGKKTSRARKGPITSAGPDPSVPALSARRRHSRPPRDLVPGAVTALGAGGRLPEGAELLTSEDLRGLRRLGVRSNEIGAFPGYRLPQGQRVMDRRR